MLTSLLAYRTAAVLEPAPISAVVNSRAMKATTALLAMRLGEKAKSAMPVTPSQ